MRYLYFIILVGIIVIFEWLILGEFKPYPEYFIRSEFNIVIPTYRNDSVIWYLNTDVAYYRSDFRKFTVRDKVYIENRESQNYVIPECIGFNKSKAKLAKQNLSQHLIYTDTLKMGNVIWGNVDTIYIQDEIFPVQ